MARTKEFDEEQVLDRALALFHEHGFQATSFATLTEELGVSRQSLYDTYGDKEALFLASVRRYLDQAAERFRKGVAAEGPIRDVLGSLFDNLASGTCSKGCFATNTLVESTPESEAARSLVLQHMRRLEGYLISRIAAAQRHGEVSPEKDPVALARFFQHTILGLSVAARTSEDRDSLRQSGRLALLALD